MTASILNLEVAPVSNWLGLSRRALPVAANLSMKSGRILATTSLMLLLWACTACGGGSSPVAPNSPLSGNWQVNLLQEEPSPQTPLSASGFLAESNGALTGSVEVPPVAAHNNCGGVASVTGTVNGQNITLSVNEGGTTLSLTGTISSDNTSMFGDYQGLGGGCFTTSTTGTWNALLIPPLTGTFTGTITNSSYMTLLNGVSPPAPIAISGSITQHTNMGGSNATLAGTITAQNYPCFNTASLVGTISGQNVYLDLIGYNGVQIGTLGQPGTVGTTGSPATVVVSSGSISLVDASNSGLFLGAFNGISATGPCPPLSVGSGTQTFDSASVELKLQ